MADRTVTVRLEADISNFVGDIGVKAVAAVKRLETAASKANYRLKQTTADVSSNVEQIGSKADSASAKITKFGAVAQAANSKVGASASKASKDIDGVTASTDKAEKSTANLSKTAKIAAKDIDAHADALGRLRTAQLRLTEIQDQPKVKASNLAGAEEAVASAERAVKKFEKAGNDSGKSFGSGLKKWFAGDGSNVFTELGKNSGNGIIGGLTGALKTPIIGPLLAAVLLSAVSTVLPAVGAVAGGALVTGFGAGIAGLGLVFASKSDAVGQAWKKTMSGLGADMQLLSRPFQSTLINIAGFFQRTVDAFNPALAASFSKMAGPVTTFVDQFSRALEQLVPAVGPITDAFNAVLATLGPAMQAAIGSIATGLTDLANSVSQNPQAFADFVTGLGSITKVALDLITTLNNINGGFTTLTGGVSMVSVVLGGLAGVIGGVAGPFELLNKVIEGANALLGRTGKDSADAGQSMMAAADHVTALAQANGGLATAAQHAAGPIQTAAEKIAAAKKAAADAKTAFEGYIASMFQLQNLSLGLAGAQINLQQAIDNASKSIKDNGKATDINTQKGRDNKAALLAVAQSANAQTEAMQRSRVGNAASGKAAEAARANFVKLATQMGYTVPQANAMAASMIAIPNVLRTAKLEADKKDLDSKLAAARAALADPKLTATKRAKLQAEISQLLAAKRQAQASIDSLTGKTVALTINTYKNMIETTISKSVGVKVPQANGGYWPHGIPSYADGKLPQQAMVAAGKGAGLVQWAEQETGGEAFIPLAPSKRDRSTAILGQVASSFGLGLVKSFADGGLNLPGGRLVDIAMLIKQLGIAFNPTSGINYGSTLAAQTKAQQAVTPALQARNRTASTVAADKADVADLQRDITLQQRYITQLRAINPKDAKAKAANDAKVKAEQKDLIKLEDQLYAAKNKSTAATKAASTAEATYRTRLDAANKAVQAHRDAIAAMVAQQQAAVQMADQISQGLQQGSDIGTLFQQTLTGKGLLSDLQAQGKDLGKFGTQITSLRKSGLSEVLVQQIIGQGPSAGMDLAQAILDGGKALVNALNAAQRNIDKQADLIGAGSAVAKYGQAVAGARAGGGDVMAGKTYRVNELGQEFFTAPVDGAIIPHGVDPNRYVNSGGSGGGTTVIEHHYHQTNTFSGVDYTTADVIAQRSAAKQQLMRRY
jgi:hypothetical protein